METATARIGVHKPIPGVVYPPPQRLAYYVENNVLPVRSLAETMCESMAANAGRLALAGPQGDVTYAELDEITDRLAVGFLRLGARPLDRVIFQISNCNEVIYAVLACIKAQLIPVCTLAAHREQEIGYLARHSSARLHVISGADPKFDDLTFAREMRTQVPILEMIVQAQGKGEPDAPSFAELMKPISAGEAKQIIKSLNYDPFQVVFFQLSGGTTGVPKIIPHFSNASLLTMQVTADWYDYRADDLIFNPLPMLHNLNMTCFYGPSILKGATFIVAPNVATETLVSIYKKYRPTWSFLSGPLIARIESAVNAGTIDFRDARGVISPSNAPRLRALLGAPVYLQYGMTEGTLTGTHEGDPSEAIDFTVGRPFTPWNRVRICGRERKYRLRPKKLASRLSMARSLRLDISTLKSEIARRSRPMVPIGRAILFNAAISTVSPILSSADGSRTWSIAVARKLIAKRWNRPATGILRILPPQSSGCRMRSTASESVPSSLPATTARRQQCLNWENS